jgi:hypothetical protein
MTSPISFLTESFLPVVRRDPINLKNLLKNQTNDLNDSDGVKKQKRLADLFRPLEDLIKSVLEEQDPILSQMDWIRLVKIQAEQLKNISHELFLSKLWLQILKKDPLQFQMLWNDFSETIFFEKEPTYWILLKKKFIKKVYETHQNEFNPFAKEIITHFFSVDPKVNILGEAFKRKIVPWHYLINIRLPSTEDTILSLLEALPKLIHPKDQKNMHMKNLIDWIQLCLEDTHNEQYEQFRLNVAKALLDHLPTNLDMHKDIQGIVKWFHQYFNRFKENSLWHRLSTDQQKRLLKWFGELSYGDFKKLITKITSKLPLQYHEMNQLEKRSVFWSNYTNSFVNLKILLPSQTVNILGDKELESFNMGEIEVLLESGSSSIKNSAEICIFETKKFIILELFRGQVGTKIYPNDPYYYQLLFNHNFSMEMLIQDSRYKAIQEFTHPNLWQITICNWLADQGMYANEDLKSFKIANGFEVPINNHKIAPRQNYHHH